MTIFFLSCSLRDLEWHRLEEEGGIQQMCKCSWADVEHLYDRAPVKQPSREPCQYSVCSDGRHLLPVTKKVKQINWLWFTFKLMCFCKAYVPFVLKFTKALLKYELCMFYLMTVYLMLFQSWFDSHSGTSPNTDVSVNVLCLPLQQYQTTIDPRFKRLRWHL